MLRPKKSVSLICDIWIFHHKKKITRSTYWFFNKTTINSPTPNTHTHTQLDPPTVLYLDQYIHCTLSHPNTDTQLGSPTSSSLWSSGVLSPSSFDSVSISLSFSSNICWTVSKSSWSLYWNDKCPMLNRPSYRWLSCFCPSLCLPYNLH